MMARRLKGRALIEAIWDVEIPEDATPLTDEKLQETACEAIKESLMDEAMATKVIVKSFGMYIEED